MKFHRRGLLAVCCAVGGVVSVARGAVFTPGDIVVFQAGDGSGSISNGPAYACSLWEFNPTAVNQSAPVQTIPLPKYDSGAQHALTTAGQFTDHLMSLSANGQYLSVIGYDVAAGSDYIDPVSGPEPAYMSPNRTIARIDAAGNVDTSTAGAFGAPGSLTHGTASVDGSGFWYTTGPAQANSVAPSLGYVAFGSSTTSILSSNYSARSLTVVDNQLYSSSSATGTIGISSVGTGIPTAGTPAITPMPNTTDPTSDAGACGFFMATLKPGDTGPDVLYVCNYFEAGDINKFSLSGGTWTLSGQIPDPVATGLTGSLSNGVVTLFTTSTFNGTETLSTVTDSAGYGAAPSSTKLTTLFSMNTNSNTCGFRGVALVPTGGGAAVSSAWDSSTSGNWSVAGNWTGGVPDAIGAGATFGSAISLPQTVTVDAPRTVGMLTFNSSASYTVAGTDAITLSSTSGAAAINVVTGSHVISAPLVITAGLSVSTAADPSGSAPSLTLPLNVSATGTLTKSGPGTLAFASSTSGISILNLPALSVTAGTVKLDSGSAHANRTLLTLGSISITGGTLDLGGNDLDIQNGSLSTITSQVQAGAASGNTGIISSLAIADITHLTCLGVIQNSVDGTTTGTPLYGSNASMGVFDGANPAASDVLVKYTYFGDANLDGKIDGSDYSRIDTGYIGGLTGWYDGDFNYDGTVDGSDYTLIDNAFNTQGASLASAVINPDASITSSIAPGTQVPEPAALFPAIFGGIGMLARRNGRRRNRR